MMMERQIAHFTVPNFAIELERLRYTRLRGRPIVLVPNVGTRAIIRAVSREAEQRGVAAGMLLSIARRVCRDLEIVPFDVSYYRSGTEAVFTIARKMSPRAEPQAFGKTYVDLSSITTTSSVARDRCWLAMKEIQHAIGVKASCGLAHNKLVSMMAAHAANTHTIVSIARGEEKEFLGPYPAKRLPAVDREVWQRLQLMGLKRIERIASFEAADMVTVFGARGARLHEQANGIDPSPVLLPQHETGKIFGEVLVPDTNDVDVVRGRLLRLIESAGLELRSERLCAAQLVCELEYADGQRVRRLLRLRRASSNDNELKRSAEVLLERSMRRRVAVRTMILRIPVMVPAAHQLDLFSSARDEKRARLDTAMDTVRQRFGNHLIGFAAAQ